jgi:FkbM family methyltransferase
MSQESKPGSGHAPFGAFAPSLPLRLIGAATRALPESEFCRRVAVTLRPLGMIGGGAIVDTEILGSRMRIDLSDNVCEKRALFTPQFFDTAELRALADAATEDFAFVDLGANVGLYSLAVARAAGPSARILAVEPQPDIFRRLSFNLHVNGLTGVQAVRCAVSDHGEETVMFVDRDNKGASSIVDSGVDRRPRVVVPCRTLDTLLDDAGIHRPDAIKLDIEGAESGVLIQFFGAADEDRWPRMLIIETHRNKACIRLCLAHGYRLAQKTRRNVILRRPH